MICNTSRQSKTTRLNKQEEHELIARIQDGDQRALGQLIQNFSGLIEKMVRRFGPEVDHQALESAGYMAVNMAALDFDLSTDNRFSSYFVRILRTEVQELYCAESGISRHFKRNLEEISRVTSILTQKLHRDPTVEEIAVASDLSGRQILNAWEARQNAHHLSLNYTYNDVENPTEWLNYQMDETADPWLEAERIERLDTLRDLQSAGHLDARHVEAVLNRGDGFSAKEIGEKLGLGAERVRQLIKTAKQTIADFKAGNLTHEPVPVVQPINIPAIPWPVRIDASRLGGRVGRLVSHVFAPITSAIAPANYTEITHGERRSQPLDLGNSIAQKITQKFPSTSRKIEDDLFLSSWDKNARGRKEERVLTRSGEIDPDQDLPDPCARGPSILALVQMPLPDRYQRSFKYDPKPITPKNNIVSFNADRRAVAVARAG